MGIDPKDLVVVGAGGQLSTSLEERGALCWGLDVVDLTRPEAAEAKVAAAGAKVVVNAAAYTAVDKAEEEEALALAINAEGPAALARGCAAAGSALIHVSTDYVFDGSKPGEYVEEDPVAPLGAYGRTKLAGEQAIAEALPRHAILRTAWVYSPFGHNFVKTMLRLADRERLTVVADQRGKPTSAEDLADAVLAVAPRLAAAAPGDPACGVFHYSGAGATHWAGFAEAVFEGALARGMISAAPEVAHITTAEYPTPAARPANSALDCGKFEQVFGEATRDWRASLGRVLDRLAEEGAR
ncbi:MAG: dTDP-4-dehydrorhamnose reductase [Pseudomonadota bacterium]